MSNFPRFERTVIYEGPPSERTLCVIGDVTGNGVPDIVLAGRNPEPELYYLSRDDDGEWKRYIMSTECGRLEAGGFLSDINRNGRLDFVAGHDSRGDRILWWENPGVLGQPWTQHEIWQMPANQSHDQFVADMDGDGRLEVYFWNQGSRALYAVPVPDDPTRSPWPGVRALVTDVREEGFAAGDVDGDGRLELVAGQAWYRPPQTPDGDWERHVFAQGFVAPRVAAGDFAGNGKIEIILAEGDASYLTERYYGRVARFWYEDDPTKLWNVEVLGDQFIDPHSLVIADFTGNGRLDLFVGELGDPNAHDRRAPAQRVYFNQDGRLIEYVIEEGLGTHESKLIQLDGAPAIVGKPYRNVKPEILRTADVDSIHLWTPYPKES